MCTLSTKKNQWSSSVQYFLDDFLEKLVASVALFSPNLFIRADSLVKAYLRFVTNWISSKIEIIIKKSQYTVSTVPCFLAGREVKCKSFTKQFLSLMHLVFYIPLIVHIYIFLIPFLCRYHTFLVLSLNISISFWSHFYMYPYQMPAVSTWHSNRPRKKVTNYLNPN